MQRAGSWHVSRAVDMAAYHWSWLPFLLPLALLTDNRHFESYPLFYAALTALSFTHRHWTLPFVYLDPQVFRTHRLRFTLAPILLLVGFAATPWMWRNGMRSVIDVVALIGAVWTVWHTLMQKYGILRLHNAKRGSSVPGWVDRLLVLGWLPFVVVVLLQNHLPQARRVTSDHKEWVWPLLDLLAPSLPWLWMPTLALFAGSIGAWTWHEHRASGLRNGARMSAGLGLICLHGAMLFVPPIKVYMAYAFSHAVEYVVFVQAYQKKRYKVPLAHRPLLGLLTRAGAWYWAPTLLGVGGMYFVLYWGSDFWLEEPVAFGGFKAWRWLYFWGTWQALLHFWYDGFLWKMRTPAVRAHI
jgi:hypothetical protein